MCKKSYLLMSLGCFTFIGALFAMLACNMFFADVANIAAGAMTSTFFVTLPAACVTTSFVLAILWTLRSYKHPDCFKKLCKHYALLLVMFNGLGIVGNIVGSIVVYGSFVSLNPFPGYSIIFLIIELVL